MKDPLVDPLEDEEVLEEELELVTFLPVIASTAALAHLSTFHFALSVLLSTKQHSIKIAGAFV